jgi:predicted metalloprotease
MKTVSIVLVCLAAVLSAGCGSSSKQASTGTATGTGQTTTSAPGSDVAGSELHRLPRTPPASAGASTPGAAHRADQRAYLTAVFDDVQSLWRREFASAGLHYSPAKLVIFDQQVHTGCGAQTAAVGPFYCTADSGVYLPPRFFDEMQRRFNVTGDLARAYVVAHEVAHHVQTQLGTTHRLAALEKQDPAGVNARSVRFELQADCLAGVWAHSSYQRGQITSTDIADALHAAAVVGSDFQQVVATGTIRPEEWTHGSSADRQRWFATGFEQGAPAACDTFASS